MKFIAVVLAVIIPASLQQCLTNDDSKLSTDPEARLALFYGQQQFALSMLQTVNALTPQANIFFSPFSVYNAMLLAYFVSSNHTEQSIRKAIFLPDSQDKLSTMQAYRLEKFYQKMRAMNGSSSYQLSSANRLFVDQSQSVRECMQTLFNDEIDTVDFQNDTTGVTKRINAWVADQTRNNILDLIPEGQLDAGSKLVLANAAYFKGLWKSKFLTESTKKEVFYISNSQNTIVTMMRQKGTFNHLVSEKLGAHILELPYKGDDVSMFVFLPPFASPNGVSNVLKRLNIQTFHDIISEDAMIPRPVEVQIPKFTVEQTLEMVPILETLGVGDLFKGTADLSSLTGAPGIQFNDAVHKAKVQVDEDGTVAAAATALFSFRSSRPLDPARFVCNHPFVYMIYDKVSQTILFVGVYNSPQER